MTQGELARRLGVSRLSVNELLCEKRALSVEMAAGLGTTAESSIAMQTALDLWEIAQDPDAQADVQPVKAA